MSLLAFAVLAGVVAVAAFVQGASGLGFALIATPVMGIVQADLLPVAILLLMLPLNIYVVWRERSSVDGRGAGWISAGRLVGTAGGFAVLVAVPASRLNLLIGGSTVLAVLASLAVPSFIPGRPSQVIAGAVRHRDRHGGGRTPAGPDVPASGRAGPPVDSRAVFPGGRDHLAGGAAGRGPSR